MTADTFTARERALIKLLAEVEMDIWNNFVNVRRRPSLAEMGQIWDRLNSFRDLPEMKVRP